MSSALVAEFALYTPPPCSDSSNQPPYQGWPYHGRRGYRQ